MFIFHDRKWRTAPTYLRKCLFVYRIYFSEFYKEYPSFSIDTEATKDKPHIGGTPTGTLGKHYSIISDENCIKLLARYKISQNMGHSLVDTFLSCISVQYPTINTVHSEFLNGCTIRTCILCNDYL